MRKERAVALLVVAMLIGASQARAEEGVLYQAKGVKILYKLTEPRPKQYQLHISERPTTGEKMCALFIAHVQTADLQQRDSGRPDGVASFILEPGDFQAQVWLTDVRIASWADWERKGPVGYGNPCLEAKNGEGPTSHIKLDVPANAAMPCDSIPVHPGGANAVQHVAIGGGSLLVDVTTQNSNSVYSTALADITSTKPVQDGNGLTSILIDTRNGAISSRDSKGNIFKAPLNEIEIACPSLGDAETIIDRFLKPRHGERD